MDAHREEGTVKGFASLTATPLLLLIGADAGPFNLGSAVSSWALGDVPGRERAVCDITIRARNTGDEIILFSQRTSLPRTVFATTPDSYPSQVRTRLGTWAPLYLDSVQPGEAYQDVERLTFYCNAPRRYRFRLQKGYDDPELFTYYFPSSSTFTKNTTLNLGDLDRFF